MSLAVKKKGLMKNINHDILRKHKKEKLYEFKLLRKSGHKSSPQVSMFNAQKYLFLRRVLKVLALI